MLTLKDYTYLFIIIIFRYVKDDISRQHHIPGREMLLIVEQCIGAIEGMDDVRDGGALCRGGVVGTEEDPLVGGLHDGTRGCRAFGHDGDRKIGELKAELSVEIECHE